MIFVTCLVTYIRVMGEATKSPNRRQRGSIDTLRSGAFAGPGPHWPGPDHQTAALPDRDHPGRHTEQGQGGSDSAHPPAERGRRVAATADKRDRRSVDGRLSRGPHRRIWAASRSSAAARDARSAEVAFQWQKLDRTTPITWHYRFTP